MPANHVLLETIELTQSAASVTFDNIPQTGYTNLKIVASMRSTGNLGSPNTFFDISTVSLNGSTSISQQQLYGNGATVYAGTGATLQIHCVGSGATANTFGNAEMIISNYTSSSNKPISVDLVTENNATNAINMAVAGLWSSSASITSVGLAAYSGSFVAGSTFSIYGIAATGTSPAIAPKAQGGNIVANDGTYWYHAFLASGTFTPTVPLSCDTLIVAGGGGGGGSGQGPAGGGGAGGLRGLTSQSFAGSTAYLVAVGSGGSGGLTSGTYVGSNGSNSSIIGGALSLSSTGGGGGGGANGSILVGQSGGSGGGGSGGNTFGEGNAGSYSPVEGYRGGTGVGYPNSSGGGGGAGAVGAPGNATRSSGGGAGGAGVNTYSTWATATNTGVSGYYAGGGSGGGYYDGAAIAGGAGGGGTGGGGTGSSNIAAASGVRNTGGGGGGAGNYNSWPIFVAGSGGSGVVIIRYAMA